MNIIGIIPARLGSSRFPKKPLAPILGIPMIAHVYERSKLSKTLTDLVIATCDKEIEDFCNAHTIPVVMTSDKHRGATDRCAEAVAIMERQTGKSFEIVVVIQGDEPMLTPEMIDLSLEPIVADASVKVVNLMAPLASKEEHEDPNEVKVVCDLQDFALYFSREPIPSRKKSKEEVTGMKQVCIMPFRRNFLDEYGKMPPTPLEIIESVDMNRILENGIKVKMVREEVKTCSVDTPEDLRHVESRMANDPLIQTYQERYSSKR